MRRGLRPEDRELAETRTQREREGNESVWRLGGPVRRNEALWMTDFLLRRLQLWCEDCDQMQYHNQTGGRKRT